MRMKVNTSVVIPVSLFLAILMVNDSNRREWTESPWYLSCLFTKMVKINFFKLLQRK